MVASTAGRGSFRGTYVIPEDKRDARYAKFPRLLDCLRTLAARGDAGYLDEPEAGEFAVVDLATREKGFFEMPYGASPAIVHSMIEGHFGAPAERVGAKLWFV